MSVTVNEGKKITVDGYHIPEPLKEYDVWVVWAPELGKTARAPWQSGHMYPAEWAENKEVDPRVNYDKAASVASLKSEEIDRNWPFPDDPPKTVKPAVLIPPKSTDNDLLFVDFDDVRDSETGRVPTEVWEILKALGGYVEVSSSGEGLHAWVRAELPDGMGKFIEPLETQGQIEMYDRGRMTGGTWNHVRGTPTDAIPNAQSTIEELVAKYETKTCPQCETLTRTSRLDPDEPECPNCGQRFNQQPNSNRQQAAESPRDGFPTGNGQNPYYQLKVTDVADTGCFRRYRTDVSNPAHNNWQGPHPQHGGTHTADRESTNFSVDPNTGVWHCFAHDSGGGALSLIAVLEQIVTCRNAQQVHNNRKTLLKTCLAARERYNTSLTDTTPPYGALVAVADWADLPMADAEKGILGETAHKYAQEIFNELSAGEII